MAQNAIKLADAREQTMMKALRTGGVGLAIVLTGGLLFYFAKYWLGDVALATVRVIAGLLALVGVTVMGRGVIEWLQTRNLRAIPVFCPYCNGKNLFAERPNADFDCDHCNRLVHFVNGEMAAVRSVECQSCHATHRVAVTLARYVCDRCNHLMELDTEAITATHTMTSEGNMQRTPSYDVVLTAFDAEHESDLAYMMQHLMMVNLTEARRLLSHVNTQTPLIVGYGLPERKAETVRAQMQEAGATVSLRSAETGAVLA